MKMPATGGKIEQVSFVGEYEHSPAAEREYIFNHVWKQVEEKFYDAEIHGIDWTGYKEVYKKFLPHINNNFDFQEMLSEMLGELNGSHTGARYYYRSNEYSACLGVLYESTAHVRRYGQLSGSLQYMNQDRCSICCLTFSRQSSGDFK